MNGKPLAGQVAFVTGAGRGLGRGGAIMLGRFGARVALVARTITELEETRRLVEAEGAETLVLPVDIQDLDSLHDALAATERELGPITALINNAAVLELLPFEKTTPEVWHRTMRINLHAAYYAMQYVYPKLVERGDGSIHNVSSGAGWRGFANETAYCASKFALEGLSRALALEAADRGVIVTLSTPGIRTKPTSVTMEELLDMPGEQTRDWADPIVMGEAFAYLAYVRHREVAGLRFDLYRVSELVRQANSLDVPLELILECRPRTPSPIT